MDNAEKAFYDLVMTRRSCRSFKKDPVPKETLDKIIEFGRYAPSGSNSQTTHFIVVTSAKKLAELKSAVTKALAGSPVDDSTPPFIVGLINSAKKGEVDVSYSAPALILTANKIGYRNVIADCTCALENMMLASTALGLGSCWINQYWMLGQAPALMECLRSFGLKDDEQVCGALAIGYADHIETTPLPRTGNPVTYV